ncbi:MAG TPA: serine/threonine-protein kinase [Nannocystaceae bacterium]|nr:serine/threonine-protein kinase [Nannocystaceae bacterium]
MGSAEVTLPSRRVAKLASADEEPRGKAVGRYILLDRLGEGGAGEVFAAYDPHLDRRVALKLLRRDDEASDGTAASDHDWRTLLKEAQALAKLSDPHVVAVYDVGVYDGRTFITMELVDGVDLATWLQRERGRARWDECLALFVQAGAGLVAAHAAGVIHRDFKPANVLLAERDGRVKVGDFGLARRHVELVAAATLSVTRVQGERTITAGAMPPGTPFYMAPELFDGAPASVGTDVYAFCVALYEAIVGERPHQGNTITALLAAKHEPMPPVPSSLKLPRWLVAAIERGLAVDPSARWPDMVTLLAALRRERSQRARAVVWLGAGAAAVGLTWAFVGGDTTCTDAARHLAWDDARRGEIVTGIRDSALPYATVTADDVASTVDAFRDRWVATHEAVCERGQRGEQSSAALDVRMACLDDGRMQLAALLSGIHRGEAAAIERASAAVHALPDPEACAELAPSSLPPVDPQLRERLATARAALELGDAATARDDALAIESAAASAGDRVGELEAASLRGLAELAAADHERAEATLTTTIFAAQSIDASQLQVRLAVSLASLLANHSSRFAEAGRWLDYADAELAHAGASQRDRGRVLATRAGLAIHRGEFAEAIAGFEVALQWQREHDDDPLQLAIPVGYYGVALRNAGRFTDAIAQHQLALELRESVLGPDHPLVALSLGHLGRSLSDAGKPAEATPVLARALAIRERVWGSDHPDVAETLIDMASNHNAAAEYAEAEAAGARALAILEHSYTGDHVEKVIALNEIGRAQQSNARVDEAVKSLERGLAMTERLGEGDDGIAVFQINLGVLQLERGELARAESLLRAALVAFERDPAVNGYEIGSAAAGLGEVLERGGRWDEAEAMYQRAAGAFDRTLPPDHPERAGPRIGLANVRIHQRRFDDAIAELEPMLAIVDAPSGGDPAKRVIVRLKLADALAGAGSVDEARTRIAEARTIAVAEGPALADLAARAAAWSPATRP